jgi:hypothetical protein
MAPSRWRQESAPAWRRGWEHPRGCPPARITAGAINAEGSSVGTDARPKGGFAYMYEPAWRALPDAVSGACRAKCVFSIRGPLPSAASVILTSLFGRFSGIMVLSDFSRLCPRGLCLRLPRPAIKASRTFQKIWRSRRSSPSECPPCHGLGRRGALERLAMTPFSILPSAWHRDVGPLIGYFVTQMAGLGFMRQTPAFPLRDYLTVGRDKRRVTS